MHTATQNAHTKPTPATRRDTRNPIVRRSVTELRAEFWNAPPHAMLSRETTAAGVCRSVGWMELKATQGGGIPFTKVGNRCLYLKSDVLAWIEANGVKVNSTSEYPTKAVTA